jgi:hypothetical protein
LWDYLCSEFEVVMLHILLSFIHDKCFTCVLSLQLWDSTCLNFRTAWLQPGLNLKHCDYIQIWIYNKFWMNNSVMSTRFEFRSVWLYTGFDLKQFCYSLVRLWNSVISIGVEYKNSLMMNWFEFKTVCLQSGLILKHIDHERVGI